MAIILKDKTLKIDLKLQLKYEIGGKEFIHYPDLTEDLEPELFAKITEAVADSMNKQLADTESNHEAKAKLDIPHVGNSEATDCKHYPCMNGGHKYCDFPECSEFELETLVQCSDCNHKHTKGERIRKSDGTCETYHCPECDSESYYTL